MYPKNAGRFTNLPDHRTPPSGLTKFVTRNPFESDLTSRLHKSVISPSVFKKFSDPQNSPEFSWSVEELASLKPAKIDEFPAEQIYNVDPDVELKAQEAIDKFFMTKEIVPSPWESKKKEHIFDVKLNTPKRLTDKSNKIKNFLKPIKKDGTCQTTLSLPPILPENIEELLKPYFSFNEEQNLDNDDANLSTSSLRRKLFSNIAENVEDEEQSSFLFSPIQMDISSMLCKSPPESGMFSYGSPLKKCSRQMKRYETSIKCSENLSPDISSIPNIKDVSMVDDIRETHSRPVMKLDFCQNLEISTSQNTKVSESDEVPVNLTINQENSKKLNTDCEKTKTDITVEINSMTVNSTSLIKDNEKNEIIKDEDECYNNLKEIKNFPNLSQVYKLEKCTSQQNNIFWEISKKENTSNIVQDTGYQTYSMNSETNLMDSSSAKQKVYDNEHFLISDDESPLSDWKENFKHIVCSTPSKCNLNEEE